MGSGAPDDPLQYWLTREGPAVLDQFTAEAVDVVGVVDRDLIVRYVNWTVPGLTREDVVGGSVLDLAPPENRDVAESSYRRVLRTGTGSRFEVVFEDGEQISMWDVRVGPIRVDGEVIGLLTISTDITEQRLAHADRDRFFFLSLDMLVVASASGRFKRANPAFGEALGYDVEDLMGTPFMGILHPDDQAHATATFATLIRGTPVTHIENRCRRKDGQYRIFSWRATVDPITGDVYAVARDITDQRATEAQLRRAQKMEAVGQLAGGIAHDFNNLTQAIIGNTELAMDTSVPPSTVAECLGNIEAAAGRAAALTKQLLAFSRRQPLRFVPVDLTALTRGLAEMLKRLLPKYISVDLRLEHGLASVSADPNQLERVILNLCVNARDAMVDGGRLTIETDEVLLDEGHCESRPWARPGRFVVLRVTDTGGGMTAEVRERIFDPFFTTKGAPQGTGLGLSTVYGIVEQHAGLIQVLSEVGEGTTFEIYLPAEARPASVKGGEVAPEPPPGRETILLAEDEAMVRRVVVQVLQRAGYHVLPAADGLEAVRLLHERAEPVHLALLDVVMPGLGGPDAWEQMRVLRPGLRVLFTSGYADNRYLEQLPDDAVVVPKPFRSDHLLRRVREALDN